MNVKRKLRQDAVWWSCTGRTQSGGFTFGAPTEIKCRWEDVSEIRDTVTREERRSTAGVLLTAAVKKHDMLFLGTLADLDSSADPMTEATALQVKRVRLIPNLRGTITVRWVYL